VHACSPEFILDIAKLLNTGKSGIDTQVDIIFKRVGVHSRMHLSQAVDYEVVRRGWVKVENGPYT